MPHEHRRLAAPDADWEATRTVPTWGDDRATGEVSQLRIRGSRLLWHFEVYDAGAPVAGAAVTIDAVAVTVGRVEAVDTFSAGILNTAIARGSRRIEREEGKSGAVAINVTAIAGLSGAQEIRIFVDEDVEA